MESWHFLLLRNANCEVQLSYANQAVLCFSY